MSLSDCPECWNTPCTCGHMGYTVLTIKDDAFLLEVAEKLDDLKEFSMYPKSIDEMIKKLKELTK